MLFGLDIDIWYALVLGLVLFCLLLVAGAWVYHEVREFLDLRRKIKENLNDFDKNKS